jgi:hypothetical protein
VTVTQTLRGIEVQTAANENKIEHNKVSGRCHAGASNKNVYRQERKRRAVRGRHVPLTRG